MKIIDHPQGSPEWKAHRKTTHSASDYPVAQGFKKGNKTRSALIREFATGIEVEFTEFVEKILANGHRVEEMAKPMAELIIGEDLFPIVATTDDGYLGASSDGATMLGDKGWECKQWNAGLAESVANGIVPDTHVGQLDQQGEVFGFETILFMVTDGTPENCVYCWYSPSAEAKAAIRPTWRQLDEDAANYVPSEVNEMPKADVTIDLPALFVHAKGEVTAHNMVEYGKALAEKLAVARSIVYVCDQDFSNAKEMANKFRKAAKDVILTKEQMLSQNKTIGEAAGMMDLWAEDLNKTALQLEKDCTREDLIKKERMILGSKDSYAEHIASLEAEIKPIRLTVPAPNFAEAIKNKRNYASMQDAVDTMLSNFKIKADAAAKDTREKLTWCKENADGFGHLFPDLQQIIAKPMEDFALTISTRVDKAKADEQARLAAEREKIRAEEQAKAEAKARREAQEAAAKAEAERLAALPKPAPEPVCVQETPKIETQATLTATAETQPETPVQRIQKKEELRAEVVEAGILKALEQMNIFQRQDVLAYCEAILAKARMGIAA